MQIPNKQTVLEVATPQCLAEDFDNEVLAMNVSSGIYCSMRDLGATLWRDLDAGHSVEDLGALIEAARGSKAEVVDFVDVLIAQGLVRPAAAQKDPADPPETAKLLAAGTHDLTIEVYDDMQSLILLDPVHEVFLEADPGDLKG